MYMIRRWVVRHAGFFEFIYNDLVEPALVRLGFGEPDQPLRLTVLMLPSDASAAENT